MATTRPHSPATSALPARAVQRAGCGVLSRRLSARAQQPHSFMGSELRDYQATVAELVCEGRA